MRNILPVLIAKRTAAAPRWLQGRGSADGHEHPADREATPGEPGPRFARHARAKPEHIRQALGQHDQEADWACLQHNRWRGLVQTVAGQN